MRRYAGRVITKNSVAPTTNAASAAKGVWTLDEAAQYKQAGTWPIQIIQVDQSYTTPGTYTFIVPNCVPSISVVAIGSGGLGGAQFSTYFSGYFCYYCPCFGDYWYQYETGTINYGGGGGGGGGLSYRNTVSVTPGQSFTVYVRGTGCASSNATGISGIAQAYGGGNASQTSGGATGSGFCGYGNYQGGGGGGSFSTYCTYGAPGGGGGGAGGYQGTGGYGGYHQSSGNSGSSGGGGGGGGGRISGTYPTGGGGGGGTGLFGGYTNGAGGYSTYGNIGFCLASGGGAGGTGGTAGVGYSGVGGFAGGGGGGAGYWYGGNRTGGSGGVRIIGPGNTRTFPNNAA